MVQQISLRLIKTRTHEFDTDFGILSDGFIKKRQATSEHIAIGKCFIYSLFQLNLSHLHLKQWGLFYLLQFLYSVDSVTKKTLDFQSILSTVF